LITKNPSFTLHVFRWQIYKFSLAEPPLSEFQFCMHNFLGLKQVKIGSF
jgi:hypothetical protein